MRLDHTFSSTDNLYYRFSFQRDKEPRSPSLPDPAWGGGADASDFQHDGRNFVLGYNHLFSPTLVMSMKAGWNKIYTDREPPVDRSINKELGLKGVNTSLAGMAQFNLTGFTNLGLGATTPNLIDSQTRQVVTDFTWIRNRHTVKFGINFSWLQRYLENPRESVGIFTLDGGYTRNSATLREGSAIADLLLGLPSQSQVSNTVVGIQRAPYYDFYIQEQWRTTQRLTLNLGIRYEAHLPWLEVNNGMSNVDYGDVLNPKVVLARNGDSRFDRALVGTDKNNFGPRFGFAYRATGRTVIRGGYGIYYANVRFQGVQFFNPPFHYTVQFTTDRINPGIRLSEGFPPDAIRPQNVRNLGITAQEMAGHFPYAQQWTFSIQQELPGDAVFEIGYYANTVHKEVRRTEMNFALPGAGNVNNRRRYSSILIPGDNVVVGPLGSFTYHERSANANFQSMQMQLEKRFSHGLSLLSSYIWSKTISDARGDAGDGGAGSLLPQDPLNLRAERSLADEHRAHRFVTSYVYELPFGRPRQYVTDVHPAVDAVLGGWTVAGITTLSSGRYVNLSVRGNPSNTGNPDRPDVLRDWRLERGTRTLDRWFDTAAFAANAQFTYGNAARNLIEGPGLVNFDFAVYKDFRVTESKRIQFRWEAFDFFNTPQFDPPNVQVGNPMFGQIGSAGRPRNLQFGLKFVF